MAILDEMVKEAASEKLTLQERVGWNEEASHTMVCRGALEEDATAGTENVR